MLDGNATSNRGLPPIGSRWRERRPYDKRIVTVIGYTDDGRVRIKSNMSATKTTARADRFGGGRSGYTRHEDDVQ